MCVPLGSGQSWRFVRQEVEVHPVRIRHRPNVIQNCLMLVSFTQDIGNRTPRRTGHYRAERNTMPQPEWLPSFFQPYRPLPLCLLIHHHSDRATPNIPGSSARNGPVIAFRNYSNLWELPSCFPRRIPQRWISFDSVNLKGFRVPRVVPMLPRRVL